MSGATAGSGTPGAQGAQAQGEGAQQGDEGAGTGPDFAAMQSALTQQGETLESMREFLASNPWQAIQQAAQGDPAQQPEQQPELDLDLGFLDPTVAATMEPDALAQRLQETIQQQAQHVAQQLVQGEVGPLREQLSEMRDNQEIAALIGEFPEIAEADTAKQIMGASAELAEQLAPSLAQALGQPGQANAIAQALADSPGFWRTTYMAGRAVDAAQQESGDIPAPATLESGSGATPGGGGGDLGDQIVNAKRGASVLPFAG